MRLHLGMPLLLLLSVTSNGALSQDRISPHADRETRKLQPVALKDLPAQALVDVYTACLSDSLQRAELGSSERLAITELRQHCPEQRKNLALQLSPQHIEQIDRAIVSQLNEALVRRAGPNSPDLPEDTAR